MTNYDALMSRLDAWRDEAPTYRTYTYSGGITLCHVYLFDARWQGRVVERAALTPDMAVESALADAAKHEAGGGV